MAEPRYVIAMGACVCGGGPYVKWGYNTVKGVPDQPVTFRAGCRRAGSAWRTPAKEKITREAVFARRAAAAVQLDARPPAAPAGGGGAGAHERSHAARAPRRLGRAGIGALDTRGPFSHVQVVETGPLSRGAGLPADDPASPHGDAAQPDGRWSAPRRWSGATCSLTHHRRPRSRCARGPRAARTNWIPRCRPSRPCGRQPTARREQWNRWACFAGHPDLRRTPPAEWIRPPLRKDEYIPPSDGMPLSWTRCRSTSAAGRRRQRLPPRERARRSSRRRPFTRGPAATGGKTVEPGRIDRATRGTLMEAPSSTPSTTGAACTRGAQARLRAQHPARTACCGSN